MREAVRAESLPLTSKSRRSRLEETRMSIDGDMVRKKGRRALYSPVRKNSATARLRLDAQTSLRTGSPIFLAYQPARISPKFPVGTAKSTSSPG